MAPPSDPLVPADLSGWFEKVVGVIGRSLVPLLIIQVGVTIVGAIFWIIVGQGSSEVTAATASGSPVTTGQVLGLLGVSLLGVVVMMVVSVFAQGASIFIAIRDAAGEPASVGTALGFAAARALPLLGWGIVAGIMMVIGFVLFILPGVYLAIVFGATLTGVVAVERKAIGRCFRLVHLRFWPTVGRLMLMFLIMIVYIMITSIIIGAVAGPESAAATILQSILAIPVGLAGVAVSVVTYAELRFHENPHALTPTLAAELHR